MKMPSGELILTACPTRCRCRAHRRSELQVSAQIAVVANTPARALRTFGDGGYLMGWGVRFGGCIGLLFLGLAAVAPLAITSDAADGRRHRVVHVQNVHHSGLVHNRAHATSPAAAPAAVRTAAQLEEAQSTIIVVAPEPGAVVTSTKPVPTVAEPAKPEPVAVEHTIQQPHAPTGWLI